VDADISRSKIVRENDPHNWNSYDHYRTIHDKRIAEHSFIDGTKPNTLEFQFHEFKDELLLSLGGLVYCNHQITLDVEKWFETRYVGKQLQINCFSYRYIASKHRGTLILKYHNLHENHGEYFHRIFNPQSGELVFTEVLKRSQFPTFTEVLDEMELLTRNFTKIFPNMP